MNPGCGHPHYSLSRGAPSATWVLLQAGQRSERDSNPRYLSVSLVFKTSAFNRSAIAPGSTSDSYFTMSGRHPSRAFFAGAPDAGEASGTGQKIRSTSVSKTIRGRSRIMLMAFVAMVKRRDWIRSHSSCVFMSPTR